MPWPHDRARDGGLDPVPAPGVLGQLWLCGKHLVGHDPEAALARVGEPGVIVCLNERDELVARYPDYVRWLAEEDGGHAHWVPIPDLHAPDLDVALALVDEIVGRLRAGQHVIVHCGAGIGRAGTTAILVLMALGLSAGDAAATVAAARPMAGPEAGPQRDLVDAYAAHQRAV